MVLCELTLISLCQLEEMASRQRLLVQPLVLMLCHSAVLRYRDRSTCCCVTGLVVKYVKTESEERREVYSQLQIWFDPEKILTNTLIHTLANWH